MLKILWMKKKEGFLSIQSFKQHIMGSTKKEKERKRHIIGFTVSQLYVRYIVNSNRIATGFSIMGFFRKKVTYFAIN